MASGGAILKVQHFDAPKDAPKYLKAALKDIGIQEWVMDKSTKKKKSNPVVEEYMVKAVGYKANMLTTPWCAYYVGSKLEDAGIACSKSGMARSYLKWGNKVDHHADKDWRVGDIVITWRGKVNDGITGHIFFLLSWDSEFVYGLGGNQTDTVCIQQFRRSKIIGMRRPRAVTESRIIQATGGATGTTAANAIVEVSIPDAPVHLVTPAHAEGAQQTLDTIQQNESAIATLSAMKPWIQAALAVITISLTAYIAWRRYKDQKERGI